MADANKKDKSIKDINQNVTLYPLTDLIENCEALTRQKKHVVVGALFNYEKEEMSKEEFIEIVETFLKRGVK